METPIHLQIFNPELLLSKRNIGTKCGAESEGKAIPRLPHMGNHPINNHQTQILLLMPISACRQEPVSWEVLPVPDKCTWACSRLTTELSPGTPTEELEKGLKELKGFSTPQEERQYQPTRPPRALRDYGSNCICSRGWLYHASMGGEVEVLGPMKSR
jgi:hypothetical protein